MSIFMFSSVLVLLHSFLVQASLSFSSVRPFFCLRYTICLVRYYFWNLQLVPEECNSESLSIWITDIKRVNKNKKMSAVCIQITRLVESEQSKVPINVKLVSQAVVDSQTLWNISRQLLATDCLQATVLQCSHVSIQSVLFRNNWQCLKPPQWYQ